MLIRLLPCFSVSNRGCGSVRLLRGSLRIQLQCCCLLTTNWVMETQREKEREERERDRVRLGVKTTVVHCGIYSHFSQVKVDYKVLYKAQIWGPLGFRSICYQFITTQPVQKSMT